ncbi:hypothetical protein [Streptomyces noursei]|uniref:hypothetical protein n=1 Tax=Streptomyces noursei TaxID=1971 RepID=UPI0038010EB4
MPLAQLGLNKSGLVLPQDLEHKLSDGHRGIRHKAAEARRHAEQDNLRVPQLAVQAGHHCPPPPPTPPSHPASRPARPDRNSVPLRPRCTVCGGRLADVLTRHGAHLSIRTADGWVDCLDRPSVPPRPQPSPAAPTHDTSAEPWPHAA